MIVYREFAINEKNMQETMKEIIKRYLLESSCNLLNTELKSEQLGISNSVIN